MQMTTEIGELIKSLRDVRGITRSELAEQSGVSISHLEKIEAGHRNPSMRAFVSIMVVLDVNIDLRSVGNTVQEQCILAVQDIFLASSEGKAQYLAQMVECMAQGFPLIT